QAVVRGVRSKRELTDDHPVLLGVADVDAGSENSDGSPVYCHPADHDHPAGSDLPAKAFRHLRAIQGRPPGSHDTDARQRKHLHVAPDVQQHRRVVDLQQRLWVLNRRLPGWEKAGALRMRGYCFCGWLTPEACGAPKPISSGVSFGSTTSRPRERKFE